MSLYDYRASIEIAAKDYPFYSLIMAAMRQADTNNSERLQRAFPAVWMELRERSAPDGALTEDEIEFCEREHQMKYFTDQYEYQLPEELEEKTDATHD